MHRTACLIWVEPYILLSPKYGVYSLKATLLTERSIPVSILGFFWDVLASIHRLSKPHQYLLGCSLI